MPGQTRNVPQHGAQSAPDGEPPPDRVQGDRRGGVRPDGHRTAGQQRRQDGVAEKGEVCRAEMHAVRPERHSADGLGCGRDAPGQREECRGDGRDEDGNHPRLGGQHGQSERRTGARRPEADDPRSTTGLGNVPVPQEICHEALSGNRERVHEQRIEEPRAADDLVDGSGPGPDERGLAGSENQERIQARRPEKQVEAGGKKAAGVSPVESVGQTEPPQRSHRRPDGPEPLAGRGGDRRSGHPHGGDPAKSEDQDRIQSDVQGVHSCGHPERCAHVVRAPQRSECGECRQHGGHPDQPEPEIRLRKTGDLPFRPHGANDGPGQGQARKAGRNPGGQGQDHGNETHSRSRGAGFPIAEPGPLQCRHAGLRSDAKKAERPEDRRQHHGSHAQGGQGLGAETGNERRVDHAGERLGKE